jgi:hypothetical protein
MEGGHSAASAGRIGSHCINALGLFELPKLSLEFLELGDLPELQEAKGGKQSLNSEADGVKDLGLAVTKKPIHCGPLLTPF